MKRVVVFSLCGFCHDNCFYLFNRWMVWWDWVRFPSRLSVSWAKNKSFTWLWFLTFVSAIYLGTIDIQLSLRKHSTSSKLVWFILFITSTQNYALSTSTFCLIRQSFELLSIRKSICLYTCVAVEIIWSRSLYKIYACLFIIVF